MTNVSFKNDVHQPERLGIWSNTNACKYLLAGKRKERTVPLSYPCRPPSSAAPQLSWPGRCWPCCCLRYRPSWCSCDTKRRDKRGGGGHVESMSITLNPQSRIPLAVFLPPLWSSHSLPQAFCLKDPFCQGESVLQQPSSILSEERAGKGSSWTAAIFRFTFRARALLFFFFVIWSDCSYLLNCTYMHTFTGLCWLISFALSVPGQHCTVWPPPLNFLHSGHQFNCSDSICPVVICALINVQPNDSMLLSC